MAGQDKCRCIVVFSLTFFVTFVDIGHLLHVTVQMLACRRTCFRSEVFENSTICFKIVNDSKHLTHPSLAPTASRRRSCAYSTQVTCALSPPPGTDDTCAHTRDAQSQSPPQSHLVTSAHIPFVHHRISTDGACGSTECSYVATRTGHRVACARPCVSIIVVC